MEKIDDKENVAEERSSIEIMQEVASRLTPEKRREFIASQEENIKKQLQAITNQEYQEEVEAMLEEESYNDEEDEWNMVLGPHFDFFGQMIKKDFEEDEVESGMICEGPTKVLKRTDEQRIQHIR